MTHKEYCKQYYQTHKEESRLRSKKWTEENKDKVKEYRKKWKEEHPEQLKELRKKYQSKSRYKENAKRHREKYTEMWKEIIKDMGMDSCSICGYNKCFNAIDFHHIKDDKKFSVSLKLRQLPKQEVIDEIKKCIAVCSNCHREIHSGVLHATNSYSSNQEAKTDLAEQPQMRTWT